MAAPVAGIGSVAASTAEVKHLADRLNAAQVKVKRLARLEAAIIDFFMEVMERTATLPTLRCQTGSHEAEEDSAFARTKCKEEHLKKAEGDPIALLNALRTHLRVHFTTHEQQFHEMQGSIVTLTARSARNARDAQEEMQKWEEACETARQQMRALADQLATMQSDHERTARQFKRSLEQLNVELHRLRAKNDAQQEQLAKKQADVDELKHANDMLARDRKRVTDELSRTGDHLRNGNGGSGSPLNSAVGSSHAISGLLGSTPAEQQNLKRVLQDYECQLSKLGSGNEELRRELQRQQQHLVSVKQSTQAQHCFKLEKDVKKQREMLDEKGKKLADQEAELLRTRGTLKERDALIQNMKDEYNKLFTALQKIKQAPAQARPLVRSASTASMGSAKQLKASSHHLGGGASSIKTHGSSGPTEGSSAELLRAQANENPYLLDHYKAKIEQLEKEIERMQTQLRKMIASEYQHKQKNRLFRVERVQLMDTCDNLRGELERAVKTTAKAMAQQSPFYMDGDDAAAPNHSNDAKKRASLRPEESSGSESDQEEHPSAATNQLRFTVTDVRRLRQRNKYLEERYRVVMEEGAAIVGPQPSERPPRPSSSSAATSLRRSSSTVEIPSLAVGDKSIDAKTMQALQLVKHSARARPQSAGPRSVVRAKPGMVTKSLL